MLRVAGKGDSSKASANDASEQGKEDEFLDAFINGSIDAIDSANSNSTFNVKDLNMDSEEWDAYSVGDKVDLDNDGEEELILCGLYGGMYLDARNNKVYAFVAGDGTANTLSYTYFNGAVWVLYSNDTKEEYKAYHMEKYEGAGNLIAEINFGEESTDENDSKAEMKYTYNEKEISKDKYEEFGSKILQLK